MYEFQWFSFSFFQAGVWFSMIAGTYSKTLCIISNNVYFTFCLFKYDAIPINFQWLPSISIASVANSHAMNNLHWINAHKYSPFHSSIFYFNSRIIWKANDLGIFPACHLSTTLLCIYLLSSVHKSRQHWQDRSEYLHDKSQVISL